MCGIAGVVSSVLDINEIMNCLHRANVIQNHRGPDANGVYLEEKPLQKVGLTHQRLAILDLTESGNQPMVSFDGQSCLVYNGEVYNYLEIRYELEDLGYYFKSNTDTEVLLVAIQHWGVAEALNRLNGMWAFAWLNLKDNCLYLARDRFGVKPLYYYCNQNGLFFASEVKTILSMSSHKHRLNYKVIGEYLLQSLGDTSDSTFFNDIFKIPPGTYAKIELGHNEISLQFNRYYDLNNRVKSYLLNRMNVIDQIRELFLDAVNIRLRSDVPIGVLLSGGIDSSSIAGVLDPSRDIKLLSAVSKDKKFDESPFIDIMGNHLGCPVNKVVLDLDHRNAFQLLEKVCWYNDEPVGSFSNVAHYLLMEKAKDIGVTVVLSGQGADELLCGYRKYLGFYIQYLFRKGNYTKACAKLIKFILNGTVVNQFTIAEARRYLPDILQPRLPDPRGELLTDYQNEFVKLEKETSVIDRQIEDISRFSVPIITHWEDRMSMAWSREVRVPFLDYRLAELLVSLPTEMKLDKGWTKYCFRMAMKDKLPPEIIWRKDKQGFVNPESEWLKHRLRPKVLEYFSEDSLIFKYGIVNRTNLLKLYEMFCHQKPRKGRIWHQEVFNPLALEIWLRQYESYIQ